MPHIFISYAHEDLDIANRVVDALAKNAVDVWINWKSIPKGEDWEQEIFRGIEEADAFLFLISPDSVSAKGCKKEIVHAAQNGKRILPIVIRETDAARVPREVSRYQWILCRDGQDVFGKAIEEISKTIDTDYEWLKYHTKLQVKALDWEKTGDVGGLLRGRELREAEQRLAGTSSQKDPQPTDLQRRFTAASRRDDNQRTVKARAFGIVLFITTIIAGVAGWVLLDRTPATVSVHEQRFEIRNRSGFRFLAQDVGSTISVFIDPPVLTPGGEYRFIVGTGPDGERPGTVLAFDMKGDVVWEYRVDNDPYSGPPGNFKIRQLYIDEILGNGKFQIIFTAQKSDWFPTTLVMLDDNGTLLGSYWNSGFIYDVLRQDFDGDGIKELVVSAVNNNLGYVVVNDETKHPVTVFALSPKDDFSGQSFPILLSDFPFASELNNWIAVFEPYIVTGIDLRIAQDGNKDLIEVVFKPQGGYIWLDEYGEIQRVGLSDYWQTLEGDKSPADYICFLQSENGDWYFPGRVGQDGFCPWYVR